MDYCVRLCIGRHFFNNNVFRLFIHCHADFKLGSEVTDDTKKAHTHTRNRSDGLEKYPKILFTLFVVLTFVQWEALFNSGTIISRNKPRAEKCPLSSAALYNLQT